MNRQSDILKGTIRDAAGSHGKSWWSPAACGALSWPPHVASCRPCCSAYGYWLVYRGKKLACAEGAACARPLPNHIVKAALVLASLLVGGAIGLDVFGPYFFSP
jgi:hypothetical protein